MQFPKGLTAPLFKKGKGPLFQSSCAAFETPFRKLFFGSKHFFLSLSTKQLGRVISRSNKIYRRGEKRGRKSKSEREREKGIKNRIWLKKVAAKKVLDFFFSVLWLYCCSFFHYKRIQTSSFFATKFLSVLR